MTRGSWKSSGSTFASALFGKAGYPAVAVDNRAQGWVSEFLAALVGRPIVRTDSASGRADDDRMSSVEDQSGVAEPVEAPLSTNKGVVGGPGKALPSLTPPELDVLALLAEGLTLEAAARRLDVPLSSVRSHLRSIATKLNSESDLDATARAGRIEGPDGTGVDDPYGAGGTGVTQGSAVTIVVGDSKLLFVDVLAMTLASEGQHDIVAFERTATGVLSAVSERKPDLCILDRWLDDGDSFGILSALLDASPHTKILVFTADPSLDVAQEAIARGAHGFVHKEREASALLGAVRGVLQGRSVVEPRLVPNVRTGGAGGADPAAVTLTKREQEILELLIEGASMTELASRLQITSITARTHVQSVLTKLRVNSRLEAVSYAVRHGLVSGERRSGRA